MEETQALPAAATTTDTSRVAWLIGISLVATAFAKLPLLTGTIDAGIYYTRNGPLLATVPLAAYLSAVRRPPPLMTLAGAVAVVVAGVVAYLLPLDTDLSVLARLHLGIALWGVVALPYLGSEWRASARRIAFVAFTGEIVLLTALLLCGGIAMSVLTCWIFSTLGIDISKWYWRNVVVWGVVTAPLVAAHLATGDRPLAIVGRVALPFVPLLLATLAAYLAALAGAGGEPLEQREFLANLNAIMVGVGFVSLAVICDRTRRPQRRLADLLNLALVALTVIVAAVALLAIVGRLRGAGYDPVRVVILGTDAVVLLLFAGVTWNYGRFSAGRAPLATVTDWIARYLPILPAWALLVAVTSL